MVRIFDEETEEVLLDLWGDVCLVELADETPAAPTNRRAAPAASKASPAAPKAAEATNARRPAEPAAPAAVPATPKAAPVVPKTAAAPQPVPPPPPTAPKAGTAAPCTAYDPWDPPPPPTAPKAGTAAPCTAYDPWDPTLTQAPFATSGLQGHTTPATPPVGNATGCAGTWRPSPAPSPPPGLGVPWQRQEPREEPAMRQEDPWHSRGSCAVVDPMDLAYRNLQNRLNLGCFPRSRYENIFGPISAEQPWGSRFWAGALLALAIGCWLVVGGG